jgi:phage FluMu protein Com
MHVLLVSLDFTCCGCREPVGVTLQCKGKGLAGEAAETVAAVNVPCPTCGQVNQLFFEPRGRVRSVRPVPTARPLPVPSLN